MLILLAFLFFFGDNLGKTQFEGVSDLSEKYEKVYDSSIKNKEDFWRKVSDDVFWYKNQPKYSILLSLLSINGLKTV